jgi:hypothetical protein
MRTAESNDESMSVLTNIRRVSVTAAIAVALFLAGQTSAQTPMARYPTPALSPWFDLYQKKAGPIDNYNMYVRPEMQLRNTLQNQQSNIQSQGTAITSQSEQLTQMEADRRGIAPTGTPTGFLNQGRYFGLTNSLGQMGAGAISRPPAKQPMHGTWALPPANAHSAGR